VAIEELRQHTEKAEPLQAEAEISRLKRACDQLEESLKQAREERELMVQELERTQAYWKQQEERWKAERAAARPEDAAAPAPAPRLQVPSLAETGEQPVLDKDEALAGVDGDLDFLRALVDVFMESSARQMAEIGAAIGRGDTAALERTARMLKGVVGTFGARAAAAAALQLETIGIVGDIDRAEQAYEKLDAEIERLKPVLVELVSGGTG
jgi:HPt (histidine-containing phosphotransfer) domain-containing protein